MVKIHELEEEHKHKSRELNQVKGMMLDNRELDERIEAARRVESPEGRLPEAALMACVKRPTLRIDAAGMSDSVSSSMAVQSAHKLFPTRHVRRA